MNFWYFSFQCFYHGVPHELRSICMWGISSWGAEVWLTVFTLDHILSTVEPLISILIEWLANKNSRWKQTSLERTIGRNFADRRICLLFVQSNWVKRKCLGAWWGRGRTREGSQTRLLGSLGVNSGFWGSKTAHLRALFSHGCSWGSLDPRTLIWETRVIESS